jgi:hypothetical protein
MVGFVSLHPPYRTIYFRAITLQGVMNQTTIEERYRERYKSEDTPWDVGRPDFNVIEVVTTKPILSCKALDIVYGTGDNSIWLA